MLIVRRVALFLLELLVEALALGALMGLLISSHTGLRMESLARFSPFL